MWEHIQFITKSLLQVFKCKQFGNTSRLIKLQKMCKLSVVYSAVLLTHGNLCMCNATLYSLLSILMLDFLQIESWYQKTLNDSSSAITVRD